MKTLLTCLNQSKPARQTKYNRRSCGTGLVFPPGNKELILSGGCPLELGMCHPDDHLNFLSLSLPAWHLWAPESAPQITTALSLASSCIPPQQPQLSSGMFPFVSHQVPTCPSPVPHAMCFLPSQGTLPHTSITRVSF